MESNDLKLAMAFTAGEFLDQELGEMEMKYGGNLDFFKKGKQIENKDSKYPFEWWTSEEALNEMNKLIKDKKKDEEIVLLNQMIKKLEEKIELQTELIQIINKHNKNMANISNQYRELFLECRSFFGWLSIKTTGSFRRIEEIAPQEE